MQHLNDQLREVLLGLIVEDHSVRDELAIEGSLYESYNPRLQAVHQRNAARLLAIIDQYGWPGRSLVGEDGAEAAWLIAQHSISNPDFQRSALELLKDATAKGEAPLWQAAMLEDRIRVLEGRPQIYGTQYDWNENAEISPWPAIEDPEHVDDRRSAVGLGPLEEDIRSKRAAMALSNEKPPSDLAERERQIEEWAKSVGWRK